MKTNNLLILALLLVAGGLTACAGEEFPPADGDDLDNSSSSSTSSSSSSSGSDDQSDDSASSSSSTGSTSGSNDQGDDSAGSSSSTSSSSGSNEPDDGAASSSSGSSSSNSSSSGEITDPDITQECGNAYPLENADYYVSPTGSDNNPGTIDAPFATAAKAQSMAEPGDLIYFRGGRYIFNDLSTDIGVLFNKSGSSNSYIRYWAYPGEVPVFDFNELVPQARIRGFSVRANWLHFRGLELTGVQQILTNVNESWGIRVENGASNNIFEQLNLHHNEGPGLFIADGANNLVLNVDSHHNYDPDRGGENADGFGCHSNDPGNVFRGNRAWYNSDDGYDFINSPGSCTVEYSMAFYNGYIPDTNTGAGNGSGFKAGGFGLDKSRFPDVVPRHQVRYNVAARNRASGFYANHHPGGLDWIHNISYNNPRNFDMLADVGAADHFLRNNVSVSPGTALARATEDEIDHQYNSWNLSLQLSDDDFESLNIEDALAPRRSDGSLPAPLFLFPKADSSLIDAGQVLENYSSNGEPDLGAYQRDQNSQCWPAKS